MSFISNEKPQTELEQLREFLGSISQSERIRMVQAFLAMAQNPQPFQMRDWSDKSPDGNLKAPSFTAVMGKR